MKWKRSQWIFAIFMDSLAMIRSLKIPFFKTNMETYLQLFIEKQSHSNNIGKKYKNLDGKPYWIWRISPREIQSETDLKKKNGNVKRLS